MSLRPVGIRWLVMLWLVWVLPIGSGCTTPAPGEGAPAAEVDEELGDDAGLPTDGLEVGGDAAVSDTSPGGGGAEAGSETVEDEFQTGTLTAGSFDDSLNFQVYEEFVAETLAAEALGPAFELAVGQAAMLTVVNDGGLPLGDARVVITDATEEASPAELLIELPTGSDGRVLLLTGWDRVGELAELNLTVFPPDGSESLTATVQLANAPWELTVPGAAAQSCARLDLAFVVDATGSMLDELEFLQAEVSGIAATVAERFPEVDQRFALIVYRDQGDEYVTRAFDFTSDLEAFQAHVSAQQADGGGDYPEAMHLALEEAADLSWSDTGTCRVLFLIADAPPHEEHAERTLDALQVLRSQAVAVYPLAASGAADGAELVMRTAALLTLSQYLFLTDDSGVGNPHAEPHVPCYHIEHLDELFARMIVSELSGVSVPPEEEAILRTVGAPVDGVCTSEDADDN